MYPINNFQYNPTHTKPVLMGVRGRGANRGNHRNQLESPAPSISSQEVRQNLKKFLDGILDRSYFPKKPRVISKKSKRKNLTASDIYERRKQVAQHKTQSIEDAIPPELESKLVEYIHGSDTSKKKELEPNSPELWTVRALLMNLIQTNRNKEATLGAVDQMDLKPIKRVVSG
jgi:hypothetical protein